MESNGSVATQPQRPALVRWLAPERDLRALYYKHFGDRRKERQLFSTGAFFVTFASVRAITHAIRAERGPFKNITPGGRHIHHMTFGIAGLLTVGYLWMLEMGINEERLSSRVTAAAYGGGAALTLDEFALWLDLEPDAYWSRSGRLSIDAVILFGSLLAVGAWGAPFFRGVGVLWSKRALVGQELGRGLTFPIRLARLLRRRKENRSGPRSAE